MKNKQTERITEGREKVTAVDWLEEKMMVSGFNISIPFFQQAKQIFEKQIADAYCVGVNESPKYKIGQKIDWENYYKRNYGK